MDDAIPRELERICLKALARRATERYPTARDLADDLRHFLGQPQAAPGVASALWAVDAGGADAARSPARHSSPPAPIKVVPKGLRAFDAEDADFFLDLLPGPRDRNGLPDNIRFWKTRVEATDPDDTFAVGLIYGPSGCGKSSMVKAGLLPRLDESIVPVYIEATAGRDGGPVVGGPRQALARRAARRRALQGVAGGRAAAGGALPPGQEGADRAGPVRAVAARACRTSPMPSWCKPCAQCDGERVQCIVMVRDDFWLAVSRFLQELEIRLVEGDNSAAGDLFDLDARPQGAGRVRPGLRRTAGEGRRADEGTGCLSRPGRVRLGAGAQGHLGAAGAVRGDG